MTQRIIHLKIDALCRDRGYDNAVSARLSEYLRLLQKWSARINLTGAKTEDELIDFHLADCLELARHLPPGYVIDVGAGAGLPSIVLSCVDPQRRVVAVEPTHKKHAFLSTVKRELGLSNLDPLALRIEDLPGSYLPADIAVSRATWAVPEWFERARTLVRPGGLIAGMEGSEKYDLPPGTQRHPYQLRNRQRAILLLRTGTE